MVKASAYRFDDFNPWIPCTPRPRSRPQCPEEPKPVKPHPHTADEIMRAAAIRALKEAVVKALEAGISPEEIARISGDEAIIISVHES